MFIKSKARRRQRQCHQSGTQEVGEEKSKQATNAQERVIHFLARLRDRFHLCTLSPISLIPARI